MTVPHPLSREAVAEFQAIYQAEFGKPLSEDEAREMALRVVRLFALLAELAPLTPPAAVR